jgi:hypothetical protein
VDLYPVYEYIIAWELSFAPLHHADSLGREWLMEYRDMLFESMTEEQRTLAWTIDVYAPH